MSPAGAEQVTLQIRSMMERAWEHIAIAYQGRAHIALGYAIRDEYVDDQLSDLRLTVPRAERGAVVQSLSRAQRSCGPSPRSSVSTPQRCIGRWARAMRLTGTIRKTQARSVGGTARVTRAASAARWRANARSAVNCTLGRRRNARGTLFAQGLGPRPDRVEVKPAAAEHPCAPGRHDTDADPVSTEGPEVEIQPQQPISEADSAPTIVESVTRAVCLIEELDALPQLVDEIEVVGVSAETAIADGIRELIEHLPAQAAALVSLVDRLERITSPT